MRRKYVELNLIGSILLTLVLILSASIQTMVAQENSLNLIQTAEYNIGFECPVATTLDPTATKLWVLMDNCFQRKFALRAYSVTDGTQQIMDDYAETLMSLEGPDNYVDPFTTPMAFTPAGDLSIHYTNFENSETSILLIPLASGGESTTEISSSYNAFLAGYSDYPDFSVYSADHTRVVAAGGTSFHVLDVQKETEIVEIPVEGGTDYAGAAFSADGERLEVTVYAHTDDMSDHSVTLLVYSLPDGDLLNQYQLPSSPVWLSPDGRYAAVNLWSNNIGDLNELVVIDLETGVTSSASNLDEDSAPVTTCLNSGNSVSDIGYMTDGRFTFPDLHWLPDSSTIILPLSYGGDAAGGGSICIFNYSRLRTYTVEKAG